MREMRVLRIHTRFPMQLPDKVNLNLMRRIANLKPTVFLSLHIDHPDEITPPVLELIREFRKAGYVLITQTVFFTPSSEHPADFIRWDGIPPFPKRFPKSSASRRSMVKTHLPCSPVSP